MITEYEQIAMNAWPAKQSMLYDGWVLRFTQGLTRRANCVNPLFTSTIDVNTKISYCEQIYKSKGLPSLFKMTSAVCPTGLDEILEQKGYTINSETSFQTLDIQNITTAYSPGIVIQNKLTEDWLRRSLIFNNYDSSSYCGYQNILQNIINNSCFIELTIGNTIIGSGLGVIEGSRIGLFDIVISKEHRNKSYGKQIVNSLIHWGKLQGATEAYLQVMKNNIAAIQLYKKIGFSETYNYWYRIKEL